MGTLAKLSNVIERIYSSLLFPDLLPEVYEEIARILGGVGAVVIPVGNDTALKPYVSGNLRDAMEEYNTHWWDNDPGVEAARRLQQPLGVYATEDIVDPDVMLSHPIYTDFGPRHGFRYFLSMTLAPRKGTYLILSVQRPINAALVSDKERRTAELLRVHLIRYIEIRHQLEHIYRTTDAVMDGLSNAANGIAILSPDQKVLFRNHAFSEFEHVGLRVKGQKLLATSPATQSELDRIISGCFDQVATRDQNSAVATFPIPDRLPLIIRASRFFVPEGIQASLFRDLRDFLLLTVVDPNIRSARTPVNELKLLGLSTQEARIASLIGIGFSPQHAAAEMTISIATARTYLKSVFDKLGVSSQTQLSVLVSQLR